MTTARTTAAADLLIGKLFGGAVEDPFPLYDELRELGDGIHVLEGLNAHMITRHADVRRISGDHKTFSSEIFEGSSPSIHNPDDPEHRRFIDTASQLFMFHDPPRHTRGRSTFRHAFTPNAVRGWQAEVERAADRSLARYHAGQEIDMMTGPAAEVPVAVIAAILGVPDEVQPKFREWSYGYASTFDPMVLGDDRDAAIRASLELFDYLAGLIAQRRAEPADDLVSHMLGTETFDGDRLSDGEMLSQLALLLVAGNETTTNLIGNGVTLLLDHPETRAALMADPARIPGAVEEMLRFEPPLHYSGRKVTVDTEFNGRHFPAGSMVLLSLGAANRDPRVYDDPLRFDIDRTEPHLSFLYGIHFCVGAHLARLEGRVFFEKLLATYPDFAAGAEPAQRRRLNIVARGWDKRPVRL
ncbi:cytochrome P450 [Nocardia sp. NPDC058176]|uniref:cytochrome P450 n=1 Tax=Nocardia sp. NPDC058176 TaxID=3346368 RepID=UPI0036DC81B4